MNIHNLQELEQQFQDAPCTLSHDELKALRQYHQAQADYYGKMLRWLVVIGTIISSAWIIYLAVYLVRG